MGVSIWSPASSQKASHQWRALHAFALSLPFFLTTALFFFYSRGRAIITVLRVRRTRNKSKKKLGAGSLSAMLYITDLPWETWREKINTEVRTWWVCEVRARQSYSSPAGSPHTLSLTHLYTCAYAGPMMDRFHVRNWACVCPHASRLSNTVQWLAESIHSKTFQ